MDIYILVIEELIVIVIIIVMHSGVVSGSFEFGETLVTIGRIGLFIGGTILPLVSLSSAYSSPSSPSWSATR
jgi:hypothetical protein